MVYMILIQVKWTGCRNKDKIAGAMLGPLVGPFPGFYVVNQKIATIPSNMEFMKLGIAPEMDRNWMIHVLCDPFLLLVTGLLSWGLSQVNQPKSAALSDGFIKKNEDKTGAWLQWLQVVRPAATESRSVGEKKSLQFHELVYGRQRTN